MTAVKFLVLLVNLPLDGPLGQQAAAGIGEPVVDLVHRQTSRRYQSLLLVVVGVRVVLVFTQPASHQCHSLTQTHRSHIYIHSLLSKRQHTSARLRKKYKHKLQ